MNDRELLEMAAKAAGIEVESFGTYGMLRPFRFTEGGSPDKDGERPICKWNPLTDDGDALRLANKLGLELLHYPLYEEAKHTAIVRKRRWNSDAGFDTEIICEIEPYNDDRDAATRQAIVRAAAEIGRQIS